MRGPHHLLVTIDVLEQERLELAAHVRQFLFEVDQRLRRHPDLGYTADVRQPAVALLEQTAHLPIDQRSDHGPRQLFSLKVAAIGGTGTLLGAAPQFDSAQAFEMDQTGP